MGVQDELKAAFPSNLHAIIKERGTTITALARELGITRQAVSQYVDGTGQPNADKLKRIADYFEVSTDWLLGRAGGVKSLDADIAAIGKYTGLSEEAINFLHSIHDQKEQTEVISAIISNVWFPSMIDYVIELMDAKIDSELEVWEEVDCRHEATKTADGGRIVRGAEQELFLAYMIETGMGTIVADIVQDAIDKECTFG